MLMDFWNHLIMSHLVLANRALRARCLKLRSPEQWNELLTAGGDAGSRQHLWGQGPFPVRWGAESAQRAERGSARGEIFTQLRAARMRKTLLLLVCVYWILAQERWTLPD